MLTKPDEAGRNLESRPQTRVLQEDIIEESKLPGKRCVGARQARAPTRTPSSIRLA